MQKAAEANLAGLAINILNFGMSLVQVRLYQGGRNLVDLTMGNYT